MITATALTIAAYLLGSISSAIIVCRLMGLPDPRTEGSNNPGATNVLRIGGKKAAAITLFGDSLKGLIPMIVGHLLGVGPAVLAAIGLAAFIGHLFPVFFGFRGGKGVATAFGVQFGLGAPLFGLWLPVGLPVALIWLFVAKVLKISSLAALISMTVAPLVVWLMGLPSVVVGMQLVMSGLLIWRHRSNIEKLMTGREARLTGTPGLTDQD